MKPRFRAEWVVVSDELLVLASCLLRPMSRNSVLEEFSEWCQNTAAMRPRGRLPWSLVKRACCVFAENLVAKCGDRGNNIHVWTSGHRGTDGNTFDWVFYYKTTCFTSATIKYRVTYTNWRAAQPDNSRNREDCVHVSPRQDLTWNDIPCHLRYCFVCENRGAS